MKRIPKREHLQLRVSAREKAAIRSAARLAGLDMSTYVLRRALPRSADRFRELAVASMGPAPASYALAELNTLLSQCPASELEDAVASPPPAELTPFLANYVAAMVEYACARVGVRIPAWTGSIAPLAEPAFGSSLASLRLHLLTRSPPPFRRRNIFIDASLGARV